MNARAAYGYPALTHLYAFFEEPETSNYSVGRVLLFRPGLLGIPCGRGGVQDGLVAQCLGFAYLHALRGDKAVGEPRDVFLVVGKLDAQAHNHTFVARRRCRKPAQRWLPAALGGIEQADITLRIAIIAVHLQRLFEERARFAAAIERERRHAGKPVDR